MNDVRECPKFMAMALRQKSRELLNVHMHSYTVHGQAIKYVLDRLVLENGDITSDEAVIRSLNEESAEKLRSVNSETKLFGVGIYETLRDLNMAGMNGNTRKGYQYENLSNS